MSYCLAKVYENSILPAQDCDVPIKKLKPDLQEVVSSQNWHRCKFSPHEHTGFLVDNPVLFRAG